MGRRPVAASAWFIAFLLALSLLPAVAAAQAWVPGKGRGNLSLSYQYTSVRYHLFSANVEGLTTPEGYVGGPDNRGAIGDTFARSAYLACEYGLLPRLAVNASLTYETARYEGKAPESPLDDGEWHGALQDMFIGTRYMFDWNQFAITPLAGVQFPTHTYDNLGHSAIGRGLHVTTLGLALGRSLDPWLPSLFLSASYTYAFVEDVPPYTLDQHRYFAQAGYAIRRNLLVGGSFSYARSVDGIDWLKDLSTPEDVAMNFNNHDVAANETVAHAGGFVSWAMPGGFGLAVSYIGTPAGSNAHAANSITIGPSWNYITRFAPRAGMR